MDRWNMKGSPQSHPAPAALLHRHANASCCCWSKLIGHQLTIHSNLFRTNCVMTPADTVVIHLAYSQILALCGFFMFKT